MGGRTTYTVRLERDGDWLMIRVSEIDGLTQARDRDEVEPMARSLIAQLLDVDPASFELHVEHQP